MSPAAVNDEARELQAELAQYLSDNSGTIDTAGSSTAYTVGLVTTPTALANGLEFSCTIDETNTGASTLVVTPSGASAFASKKWRKVTPSGDVDLVAQDLVAGQHIISQYDSAADSATGAHIVLNPNPAYHVVLAGTVSAAATLDLALPSGYSQLRFALTNVVPATSGTGLVMRVSTDGGSTYISSASAYKYAYAGYSEDGATADTRSAGAASIALMAGTSADGVRPANIEILLPDYANASSLHPMLIRGTSYITASTSWWTNNGMGVYAAATGAITHVRFLMSTGNISTMTYRVFGER
jgi:hypothetical protein